MDVNDIIERIVNDVNPDWPTIYKIRYVYIALGKKLQKNTDFFFSLDKKLGSKNMSFEEVESAYNSDGLGDVSVICKSSSLILKEIYDRLGIECKIVKSLNNVLTYDEDGKHLDINHWFLAVKDGDLTYFCTLSSDLPYIQMGMETHHFGVNIPYKKVVEGKEEQVYEGEEIKHTVIKKAFLRQIDLDIGYIKYKYHYNENYELKDEWFYNYDDAGLAMLSREMNSNKLYVDLEKSSTDFYKELNCFTGENGRQIDFFDQPFSSLTDKDWIIWEKKLCDFVMDKINLVLSKDDFPYTVYSIPSIEAEDWNYDEWLVNLCSQLQRYFFYKVDDYSGDLLVEKGFDFSKWSRKLKGSLDSKYKKEQYDNILIVLDKMNALINMVQQRKFGRNFSVVLNSLAYNFIHEANLFEKSSIDGKVSSKYIAHKFKKLFVKILDCNYGKSDISNMGYSEQVVIIKNIIERMFKELNKKNSSLEEYNDEYSAVFNRIQIYAIKNKKDGEYAMVFHILDDGTYTDTYYFYDPKNNVFSLANILQIYSDYIIVSERFKSRISNLENIEEPEKRAKF